MTTPGSLSIEKPSIRRTRADIDAALIALAVGLMAGLAVTYLRTPLQLPGHKALFWVTPALATRLIQHKKIATIAIFGTILSATLLGGRIGGSLLGLPLVLVAGVFLDLAATTYESVRVRFWVALAHFAIVGAAANLIALVQHFFEPIGRRFSAANLTDLLHAAGSYTLFGLLSGATSLLLARILVVATPSQKEKSRTH